MFPRHSLWNTLYKKNNVLYLALLEDRLNPTAMFVAAQLDENIEEDGHAM